MKIGSCPLKWQLASRNTASKLHQNSVLLTWDTGGIRLQTIPKITPHGSKATQCTRNLTTFSTTQCTHKCRCWKSGGVQSEYCNPNHFTFPILEALNPFHFLVSHYAVNYLDSCFHHFITLSADLNRLTTGAKVEFMYNVLNFVDKCIDCVCKPYIEIPCPLRVTPP